MLKNIKSTYFIKTIFSYFDEGRKLNLIKYNKKFQELLSLNLINYKLYSGRYIIFANNQKGKEYDSKYVKLLYEGEYLNGKRNGKGIEFDYGGNIEYEGEYLNGKRNGYGKEYFYGQIIFEGEYLNGNKLKGKGYDYNDYNKGKLIYEINNENGKGKEYDIGGLLIFEGEYLNGERNGKGREYDNSSLIFEGEFLKGKRHGKGKDYFNGVKWNGKGYDFEGKNKYELINGKACSVIEYDNNGQLRYKGEYLNGKRNGKGKEYDNNGQIRYEGEYLNGKRNGKGKEYNLGKLIFEGEYLYNHRRDYVFTKWNGKGYDINGNIIYELNKGMEVRGGKDCSNGGLIVEDINRKKEEKNICIVI